MNGNELTIFFVALIGIPICLWCLIKIPNARSCGSCGAALNAYRQKTYHIKINNENTEICKKCYAMRTKPFAPRITYPQVATVKIPNTVAPITQNPIKAPEPSQKQYPIKPMLSEITLLKPESIQSVYTTMATASEAATTSTVSDISHKQRPLKSTSVVIDKDQLGENISISEVLEEIKSGNCFWLDTETTGLSTIDKIIEISICKNDKQVVFDSILRSTVACSEQARAVHHITDVQIANGMPIELAKATLLKLLEGKTIISFNADFDCQMLYQTIGLRTKKRFCVMKWSQSVLDYERWPRLEKVCERLNITQQETHRSLADTFTTIDVFNKLVDLTCNHKSLLRDFASIDLNAIERLEEGDTLFLSPNSNIFAFDRFIDRHGNDIIGIRSKALKRMLKKEGVRIFVKNTRKGKTLSVQYINQPDLQLPISKDELSYRLGALKLKNIKPNKYLSMKATLASASINRMSTDSIDGTYYFPSSAINSKIYEDFKNLPIYHNNNRDSIAFIINNPKNSLKKMFALGLQGYSSILMVVEDNDTINISAFHLLDAQKISILGTWELDGEKSWSGDY